MFMLTIHVKYALFIVSQYFKIAYRHQILVIVFTNVLNNIEARG